MHKERTYKVIIKQYSPVEDAIILAGPFDTEEEADAIANQLSGRIALKPNQYLTVFEEVWCWDREIKSVEDLKKFLGFESKIETRRYSFKSQNAEENLED